MYALDLAYFRALTPIRIWNAAKVLFSYYVSNVTRRAWTAGLPIVLSVEPTNICNLKCPQCPSGSGALNRPQGYMDIKLFDSLLQELRRSTTQIQFYFQGEPFLHKSLMSMVKSASDKRIHTLISSNGHFLTDKNVDEIIDSGLNVLVVGIDGTTQQSYETYRKNGNLDRVISGLKLLSERKLVKKIRTPKVYLQFLVMKNNADEIEKIHELGREVGADRVTLKTAQMNEETDPDEFLPSDERYSRYSIIDGKAVMKSAIPDRCRRIWTTAVLTWDGRLAACCFDKDAENAFGEYRESGFTDIWRGEKSMRFRNAVLSDRKRIPICTNCTEGIREFIS